MRNRPVFWTPYTTPDCSAHWLVALAKCLRSCVIADAADQLGPLCTTEVWRRSQQLIDRVNVADRRLSMVDSLKLLLPYPPRPGLPRSALPGKPRVL